MKISVGVGCFASLCLLMFGPLHNAQDIPNTTAAEEARAQVRALLGPSLNAQGIPRMTAAETERVQVRAVPAKKIFILSQALVVRVEAIFYSWSRTRECSL